MAYSLNCQLCGYPRVAETHLSRIPAPTSARNEGLVANDFDEGGFCCFAAHEGGVHPRCPFRCTRRSSLRTRRQQVSGHWCKKRIAWLPSTIVTHGARFKRTLNRTAWLTSYPLHRAGKRRVPKRGGEPLPSCLDMEQVHARLPIPPLGQERRHPR